MTAKTSSFRLGDDAPPPSAQAAQPGLVLAFAPGAPPAERAFVTETPATVVGRDDAADVCLAADDAVSGRHAVITCEGGRLAVTDLGSRNGVFVNGHKVTHAELAERDVVRFGRTLFLVVQDGAAAHRDHLLDGTRRGDSADEAEARKRRGFAGGLLVDRIAADLRRAAPSRVTVILRGESGTGKEVFAKYVHAESGRNGRLVAVNASAIPPGLVEAELFGAVRGAYSGATQDRRGLVREAHQGTLFLDEIGDMPLEAQSRLLRVLQEREVTPVGASRPERVDVRVIAATHRDLEALVASGKFRGDLYARLKEHEVRLPPLRDRLGDIVPLCRNLLERHGRPDVTLGVAFVERLLRYPFPYNVRELEHTLTRALALLPPGRVVLGAADLPEELRAPGATSRSAGPGDAAGDPTASAPPTLASPGATRDRPTPVVGGAEGLEGADEDAADRAGPPAVELLRGMLAFHAGSVVKTAHAFGVSRAKLYRWLAANGIEASDYR